MNSSYVLIYKNGLREYFGNDGRLLGIVDSKGNTIKFQHTLIDGYPLITKITDTIERSLTISYNTIQVYRVYIPMK